MIRQALTDLRLIIDSMDSSGEDINQLLGMFRSRIQYQLDIHNIDVSWRVDEIDDSIHLSADKRLQLIRILQEIINNIIKHSKAERMILKTAMETIDGHAPVIRVQVSDNGRGFDLNHAKTGRGLNNIRQRADTMNAQLDIQSTAQGTTITLLIKIQDNTEEE